MFYQVSSNIYLILWGFILAFLQRFNALALWLVLVVLPLAVKAWRNQRAVIEKSAMMRETAETILTGMYGWHTLRRNSIGGMRRWLTRIYCRYFKGHLLELLGLCLIFLLILCTFGQYHFTRNGFAYGDENVHFYWAKELLHGNPFPAGMYPHGMHFVVAALSSMFGITLSRASMIIGLFNVCLLFCTLYLVLKETFLSRTAVLFGIGFFLATNIFAYYVYWRYQAALPMEMGLIPYCIMFYGLRHYVESRDRRDLLLFVLSLGWCIHVHFYAAILAAFSCLVFGIVFLIPMLRKNVLHWIVLGGLLGVLLGCVPFGLGKALDYPFEQSMGWAMGVIENGTQAENAGVTQALPENTTLEELWEAAFWAVKSPAARNMLFGLDITLLLWGALGGLFSKKNRLRYFMMLFWGLAWLMGLGISTGVISLIQGERFAVFFGFLSVPLFVVPAQMFYSIAVSIWIRPKYAEIGLAAAVLAFFFFMVRDGYIKNDFTVETGIISEGDMKACYRIMEEYPDETWAVISTTYDFNLVRYYGYHYEIIDLLKRLDSGNGSLHLPLNDERIYVPTKDIFVVVENKIDQYDEANYRRNSHMDAYDLENHGDPTPELALTELPQGDMLSNSKIYAYPWRGVVMSKLYYWMEKVKEAYPNEVSVFYQDEAVTVYHISQDEYFPLELMLDYQSDLR